MSTELRRQEVLDRFRRHVVSRSKANLTTMGKKSSSKLYNSIKGESQAMKNSIRIAFIMQEYGEYQDKGVKGAGGVRKTTSKFNSRNNKGKMWKQNAPDGQYKFTTKKPSYKHFTEWANKKGLSDHAVANVVFHQGIKRSLFFTRPFEAAFKNLPDELIKAYGFEVQEQFLELIPKDGK